MTNFKYFTINSDSNIDDIKKQYKKLAFQYHPDVGGTDKEMQEVNAEYELALDEIGKIHNKLYTLDNDFINIIDALIKLKMVNVTIEICGWFVWVSGETKPYKDKLGKNGLKLIWNNDKSSWYYKPNWYRMGKHNAWSMDQIRSTYGSQKVSTNNKYKESELIPAI